MTDQKKPEELSAEDLDNITGGYIKYDGIDGEARLSGDGKLSKDGTGLVKRDPGEKIIAASGDGSI